MKTYSSGIVNVLVIIACSFSMYSCVDESRKEPDYTTYGNDVALTIPCELPEMRAITRAGIADADRDGLKSLWVAVFDASTGEITSKKADGVTTGWYEVALPGDYGDYQERKSQSVTLRAKSGYGYIVAVGNVDNDGVSSDSPSTRMPLRSLLTDNLTWEGFNKIAVPSFPEDGPAEGIINAPDIENGIPMSGCYSSLALGGEHPADWSATDFKPVFIPSSESGAVTMDGGAIHLRRLISHVTFKLEADGKVVDLSVEGFRLYNAPNYSWLYERGNASDGYGANFGDAATEDDASLYYHAPVRFGAQYVTVDASGDNPVHAFDFWMMENKHTGTAADYNDREVKSPASAGGNVLFTALTGDSWTPDNMASYVIIRCDVTYKEQTEVDDNGLSDTDDTKSFVYRSGVSEYIIHLGYVGDDATDFNSYRNADYVYNIKVSGLNEIVVEANNQALRNSVEGIVTDVETRTIQLDAHYSAFNIVFTEEELKGTEEFGYIVTSYESGVAHTFTNGGAKATGDDRKYVDWVELKSTSDASTLAVYKPATRGSHTAGDDAVIAIDEFYDKVLANKDNPGAVFTKANDGNYYFTVFVNEYAYEPRFGDAGWGKEGENKNWHTYVNQPSRHFYFRVRRKESLDGKSVYARSKYAVDQQSIQTYYSTFSEQRAGGSPSAVGIEHINECQGLNLRKSFTNTTVSNANGRWNVHRWLSKNESVTSPEWKDFVQASVPLRIPDADKFTGKRLQGGPQLVSVENGWNPASGKPGDTGFGNLPALVPYGGTVNSNMASSYDPQPSSTTRSHYIEAINACMNRNRDENGDGHIDKAELKWYVPASGKYLRAILGRNSLTDPIMPYLMIDKLNSTDNGQNSRWLMYSSDDKVAWAMEGLSMSDWDDSRSDRTRIPWNVRCIRNLGTDLTTTVNDEKVQVAYVHDAADKTVRMSYYDNASIRTEKISGKGNGDSGMPMHPVTDKLNKVYYAFEYSDLGGPVRNVYPNNIAAGFIRSDSANPCNSLSGEGWRLPNQKELAIMRNLGLFVNVPDKNSSSNGRDCYAVSCTYDYFTANGEGTSQGTPTYTLTSGVPNHRLMVTRNDGGTRLPQSSGTYYYLYYRCVRDVEP